jgi:hypothetical protein
MLRVQFAPFERQVRGLGLSLYPPRATTHALLVKERIHAKRAKLRLFVQFLCNLHDSLSTRHGTAPPGAAGREQDDAPDTVS